MSNRFVNFFREKFFPSRPEKPPEMVKIQTTCSEHLKTMQRLARIEGENLIILTMLGVILYYLIVR